MKIKATNLGQVDEVDMKKSIAIFQEKFNN